MMTVSVMAEEKFRRFMTFDSSYGLADNSAQTIKCTKTGRMVISTIGHINFYDGLNFTHIDPTAENIHPLPSYMGHYHMYFDRHHHLWLKDKRVVTCLDLLTERFVNNVEAVYKQMGMNHKVDDIFADHDFNMWFLSGEKLYSTEYNVSLPVRQGVELQDMDVCDSTQVFLFYGDGQLSVYDLKTSRHLYDTAPVLAKSSVDSYSRSSVVRYHEGTFYQIRNGSGEEAVLLSFDVATRQWRTLQQVNYHLNNIEPYNSKLYIPSSYGYWVYDIKADKWEHVEYLTMDDGRQLLTDINIIAFDRQGGMWLGTEKRGLLYARPYPSPFIAYDWSQPEANRYALMMDKVLNTSEPLPRRVNCIFYDSRGWRWTGTFTGLQLQKGKGDAVRTFTRQDGLNNEMIHSIIEDDNHNIWVSTSFGITQLEIKDGDVKQIRSYDHHDNVPNESFINGRVMKLDDGRIVMQAQDHVIEFNPAEFHNEKMAEIRLYPKLTRWLVNGTRVVPGVKYDGKVLLERSITRTWELNVNYNQNSMVLSFSGLNYWRPVQTYYRLRLKGIYNDWQILSHANSSNLVNAQGMLNLPLAALKPGKYQIELQASMSPDRWDVKPLVWNLEVHQPWWRSTGIYILLFALLIMILLANVVLFNRNTRLRMIRNNEEADMQKSIRGYVQRCNALSQEILTPYSLSLDSVSTETEDNHQEFMDVMVMLVNYVNTHREGSYTLSDLAAEAKVDLQHFYVLLSNNLYKSPRQLALRLRLQKAADQLLESECPVEEVADHCGFVSPNYFIASFYHQYRKTPADYRISAQR